VQARARGAVKQSTSTTSHRFTQTRRLVGRSRSLSPSARLARVNSGPTDTAGGVRESFWMKIFKGAVSILNSLLGSRTSGPTSKLVA